MKLSGRRLLAEEFREQSTWIGRLLQSINDFVQQVTFLSDNKITFKDNLAAQINELDITVQASNNYPIYIKCKFSDKPVGLWVGNAFEVAANPGVLTSPIYVDWEYVNGQIKVNNISGLTSPKRYKITVFISYG
jgi:hypothetical protein